MIDNILECAVVLNWNASTQINEATRSKLSTGLNRAFLEVSNALIIDGPREQSSSA